MQTLRTGCSKAETKISPRRRPPSRGAGWPKINQLEMVTTFTYKPSLVRIDACNFTHKPTNKQTGPITIHCAAASAQSNDENDDDYAARLLTKKEIVS